ncbi:MAG: GH92 family glycosyl hydrolase [Cytophagales bacterium]|nr:GH92 family glycosyl hydrolase [Cytophagales bacterium]
MKSFLKFVAIIFGIIILSISLVILGCWFRYRSIVDQQAKSISHSLASEFPRSALVNPFIGTGGVPWTCAYNFPGASLPFGVVRLSPETASMITNDKGLNTSGYFYGDNKMIGFSHTRLVGTGATDGGHFLFQPVNQAELTDRDPVEIRYKYTHRNELAYPGYYGVDFPEKGIKVELTSTRRVGIHRYTFSGVEKPGIFMDVTHTIGEKQSNDGYLNIKNEYEIEGHARTFGSFAGRYGGIKVYFAARFSAPIKTFGIWNSGQYSDQSASEKGDEITAHFSFDSHQLELQLAISHVSMENAWENLKYEVGEKDFDQVTEEALKSWEDRLSSVSITGGNIEQQTNFYTALYRSFQMPTIFSDVNGEYLGFDKRVHRADGFDYFTDMSIWDTFRTTHPLYNLIAVKDQRNMIESLILMAKQGGWLPRWPSGNGYTNSMLGSASDIVISEAYQKGICDFDVEFAYQNMKKIALASTPDGAAFSGRRGNNDCVQYGYCPADSMDQAVSRTLEYAWSDYSISLLANALGYREDAEMFRSRSMNYKNVWNPETQYFQPRNADGTFDDHFKPLLLTYVDGDETYTNDYVEGSALQWRWAPFFDAPGLIELFDSKSYFIDELDKFFENSDYEIGYWYPGSHYWHGNEPDIHAPYLFNHAGRPDLTQKWVRWILGNKYMNRYDGLDGNDDAATLSAWYIFSALGFYPVAGTDVYQLGAPLFEKAEVNLENGSLEIVAENYGPDRIYADKIWLNDSLLNRTWIKHREIANGGVLKFEMSRTPPIR